MFPSAYGVEMAEINQDSEDIESTEGFRHGILTALCFVTPVVVGRHAIDRTNRISRRYIASNV